MNSRCVISKIVQPVTSHRQVVYVCTSGGRGEEERTKKARLWFYPPRVMAVPTWPTMKSETQQLLSLSIADSMLATMARGI